MQHAGMRPLLLPKNPLHDARPRHRPTPETPRTNALTISRAPWITPHSSAEYLSSPRYSSGSSTKSASGLSVKICRGGLVRWGRSGGADRSASYRSPDLNLKAASPRQTVVPTPPASDPPPRTRSPSCTRCRPRSSSSRWPPR